MNTSEKTDYGLQYININQNQTNMDFSLWKLSYIDLILVLKFLSTMDKDLIGIFKIDKSMYKSMFTKILPNPVQVLGMTS